MNEIEDKISERKEEILDCQLPSSSELISGKLNPSSRFDLKSHITQKSNPEHQKSLEINGYKLVSTSQQKSTWGIM